MLGTDYTLDAENLPKPTPTGTANAGYVIALPGAVPYVQYQADLPDYASIMFEAETIQVKAGAVDPTLGYYSATNYAKGRLAEMNFRQSVVDIVVGRRPMSDYDPVVAEWRNTGGALQRRVSSRLW